MSSLYRTRQIKNILAQCLATLAALFGLFWLTWILWTTLSKGLGSLNLDLFTKMTPPPGDEGGGMLNAFFGSAIMSLMGVAIGAPIGVLAGTFLAEYSSSRWSSRLGESVRFVNDILLSAPSIVLGLFVYTLVVAQMGHFSAIAGAIALAFIVLPVVVRTTDEMLRLVPAQMREAALSLGVPQWKVTVQVLYRSASAGIVTGILLALARISGETAPLLFTALNNQYSVLDDRHHVADGERSGGHLPVRDEPLRGMAHAGVGRRVRPHHVRARGQPDRAPDPAPQQDFP
jgi:phosphate transport system permease protein